MAMRVKSEVLSYEGPFGVGYGIARFRPEGKAKSIVSKLYQKRQSKINEDRKKENPM